PPAENHRRPDPIPRNENFRPARHPVRHWRPLEPRRAPVRAARAEPVRVESARVEPAMTDKPLRPSRNRAGGGASDAPDTVPDCSRYLEDALAPGELLFVGHSD